MEDHFNLMYSLLNDKTVEVYLGSRNFWKHSNYLKSDLLGKIAKQASNLEKLAIDYEYGKKFPSPFSKVKEPMHNLRTLDVYDWLWSDCDLELMTSMVPNLEELQVCNIEKLKSQVDLQDRCDLLCSL
jgi:hypothetical protein